MLEAAYDHFKDMTRALESIERIEAAIDNGTAYVQPSELQSVKSYVRSTRAWINALADGQFDPALQREQYGPENTPCDSCGEIMAADDAVLVDDMPTPEYWCGGCIENFTEEGNNA